MRNYLINKRGLLGLSQLSVSEMIGLSRQSYQAIEAGRRQVDLKTSTITKLAHAFGVSASELYQMEAEYQAERAATLQAHGMK